MLTTVVESLAAYRKCQGRIAAAWPDFLAKRDERLAQQRRFGAAAEKVAENVLEDLFTMVLDWRLSEVNNQLGYADLVLTRLGIRHLIIEVKRPGSLAWNERAVGAALAQAERYASEQKVRTVAVSDGVMMYARDQVPGGHRDRVFARLDQPEPSSDLWWLSTDGIYRPRQDPSGAVLRLLPPAPASAAGLAAAGTAVAHPKYRLPAACFAYAGDASDPGTWSLPYLLADGTPDPARLPKAIQAILSNYRGTHLTAVPEAAIPEVLVTLARAAASLGKLPAATGSARTYAQLQQTLDQLGRLSEVLTPRPRQPLTPPPPATGTSQPPAITEHATP